LPPARRSDASTGPSASDRAADFRYSCPRSARRSRRTRASPASRQVDISRFGGILARLPVCHRAIAVPWMSDDRASSLLPATSGGGIPPVMATSATALVRPPQALHPTESSLSGSPLPNKEKPIARERPVPHSRTCHRRPRGGALISCWRLVISSTMARSDWPVVRSSSHLTPSYNAERRKPNA
jgi:hypothetical protein